MRKTLAVVVLALSALVGLPSTAQAGGPTSVLITQPGPGLAAALYYTSADYAELERLLGSVDPEPVKDSSAGGGVTYNVTWMIHDVQPWRHDAVRVTPDGRAFVATTDEGDLGTEPFWREVGPADDLTALLARTFTKSRGGATSDPAPAVRPAASPSTPAVVRTEWWSLTGWRWVVPGVLAGLLVGALAARRREVGPRRVLEDRPPAQWARTAAGSVATERSDA